MGKEDQATSHETEHIAQGTNLALADRTVRLTEPQRGSVTGQNAWSALRAAHAMAGKKPDSLIVVRLYNAARTCFQSKSQ